MIKECRKMMKNPGSQPKFFNDQCFGVWPLSNPLSGVFPEHATSPLLCRLLASAGTSLQKNPCISCIPTKQISTLLFFPFNYNSSTRKKASQQTNHVSGHLSALCLVLRTPLMPEDSPKPKWPPRKGTAAPPQWPRMFCDSMTGRKCLDKAAAIQLKHV